MMSWSLCGAFCDLPENVSEHSISISGRKMDVHTFFLVCTLLELLSDGRLSSDMLSDFLEDV